jgi:hypothetical protein
VLGWNYASVVHTQTDYGTTGYDALGRRKKHWFSTFKTKDFSYTDNIHIQKKIFSECAALLY